MNLLSAKTNRQDKSGKSVGIKNDELPDDEDLTSVSFLEAFLDAFAETSKKFIGPVFVFLTIWMIVTICIYNLLSVTGLHPSFITRSVDVLSHYFDILNLIARQTSNPLPGQVAQILIAFFGVLVFCLSLTVGIFGVFFEAFYSELIRYDENGDLLIKSFLKSWISAVVSGLCFGWIFISHVFFLNEVIQPPEVSTRKSIVIVFNLLCLDSNLGVIGSGIMVFILTLGTSFSCTFFYFPVYLMSKRFRDVVYRKNQEKIK